MVAEAVTVVATVDDADADQHTVEAVDMDGICMVEEEDPMVATEDIEEEGPMVDTIDVEALLAHTEEPMVEHTVQDMQEDTGGDTKNGLRTHE